MNVVVQIMGPDPTKKLRAHLDSKATPDGDGRSWVSVACRAREFFIDIFRANRKVRPAR